MPYNVPMLPHNVFLSFLFLAYIPIDKAYLIMGSFIYSFFILVGYFSMPDICHIGETAGPHFS